MPTPRFRTSNRSARTVGLVTSRPRSPGGLHVRGIAARVVRVMLLSGITAGALAAQQPAKWRLVEEWRVGGEVDGPHSFGDVRALAYLPDGRIVVLDARDQQVHYLDATGQPVRTVGRKGAGPGEFAGANGLVVTARGEVVVNDHSNNRLTVLAPNGDFVKTVPILNVWGFGYTWDAYVNARGLIDEYVSVRREGAPGSLAARRVWSADYARIDTILPLDCPGVPKPDPTDVNYQFRSSRGGMVMQIPFVSPRLGLVRSADGATWAGRYPGYAIIEHVPPGTCTADATIRLTGRVRVPAAMRDSEVGDVRTSAGRYGVPVPDLDKIPREFPGFEAVFLDSSKRLWVERRTTATERRFEVYGPGGDPVAEVDTPRAFAAYRPVVITNDRALGFVTDEDDVLYLVSYRIVRG